MNNKRNKKEQDNQEEKEIYLTEMNLEEFSGIPKEVIQRMFEEMAIREDEHK